MLTDNQDKLIPLQTVKVWDTPGGVHPPENKHQSMQATLADIRLPKELIFPLGQSLGAPAEPIVNVGDHVLGGQTIAESSGHFGTPVHASSSGTVTAIEERALAHTSGMTGLCIVIASDGQHNMHCEEAWPDYQSHSPSDLIQKIQAAGITGLGGAGFPTSVKPIHPIHTLLIP